MAKIEKNFVSVVALGSQNPQILNEDFLKVNKIIPSEQSIFEKKTNFISTPILTTIAFGSVEIIVEERRFQIRHTNLPSWTETPIFDIVIKYYDVLKFTPVETAGFNFNCKIVFDSLEEANNFHKILLPDTSKIKEIISEDVDVGMKLLYSYKDNGRVLLTIERLIHEKSERVLNFNYEFSCLKDGQTKWSIFKERLSKVDQLTQYFSDITGRLLEII